MQAGVSPLELLTSTLRFKWTLVVIFALVSGPMIAGIWTQVVPKYQARAEIRVRPIIPRLVFRTEENGMIPLYDSFVNTQVSLVRSMTVLQRVLEQSDVQGTPWYKNAPQNLLQRLRGDSAPAMERLRDDLSVRPRPKTEIIDVSFSDVSSKDAVVIVNAVVDQYMKYYGEASGATEDALYRQLVEQNRTLENDIRGRENICAEIQRALGTGSPQELVSSMRLRLDQMLARLAEVRNRIAILEWEIQQAPADGNTVGPAAVVERQPPYHQDAEWRKLDLNVKNAEQLIAATSYTANHPEGMRLVKNLNFARDLLQQRQKQLDELWGERAVAMGMVADVNDPNALNYTAGVLTARHQLARARQEELLLQGEATKQQAEFTSLFESAQTLERETNELRNKRELYDEVRRRLDQKNIERNVPGSIELLTRAVASSKPQEDRRVVFTAMAICLGLGLGAGVAFLRAHRDQGIYVAKDMPVSVQVLLLGHVPLVSTNGPSGRMLYDEAGEDRIPLIESVRVMRTALLSRLNGARGTTILITSAAPRTGKSSFTMALGKSLAETGKRVLMVDGDFHTMTLSAWSNLAGRPGFIDALRAGSADAQHVVPTPTPGLFIMPAGRRDNDRVVCEEMANGAFAVCMGQLAQQYDITLLDGPPVLPVADATVLAARVDGIILVERGRVSRRLDIVDALARLNSVGGRLLGTVFVGSPGREGYGYRNGDAGERYGRRPRQPDKNDGQTLLIQ